MDELKEIGMKDVTVDDYGYVMATLPANTKREIPTIGFLAHLDTATDFTGKNVNPQIVENYDGQDLILNQELGVVLDASQFPELQNYKGHTLITTDGTTLLGTDNKAGIAEIVTAMEDLIKHTDIPHVQNKVPVATDQEIGRELHKFDVIRFHAMYAYTVDGGPIGELQYENYNAANLKVTFHGIREHPVTAKHIMNNAGKMD